MKRSASSVVLLASSLLCLLSSARSQNPAPAPTFTSTAPSGNPEDALRHLDRNDVGYGPVDALSFAEVAAQAPPEQAIPALERFYEKHKNDPPDEQLGIPYLRDNLASLLVQLGDPNPIYWNVLVSEADLALASEVPYPNLTNGKTLEDAFTPEQKAWAKAHNMSLPQAFREATFIPSQKFAPLAKTGDPRALPILRTGLKSENLMIQSLAAGGLGLLRDKDSIPVIIAICRARQPPLAYFVAASLVFFHDPTADKVYHEYFPDRDIENERQSNGGSPFGGTVHHPFGQNAATPAPQRSESSAPNSSPAPPPQTPPGPDTAPAPAAPQP